MRSQLQASWKAADRVAQLPADILSLIDPFLVQLDLVEIEVVGIAGWRQACRLNKYTTHGNVDAKYLGYTLHAKLTLFPDDPSLPVRPVAIEDQSSVVILEHFAGTTQKWYLQYCKQFNNQIHRLICASPLMWADTECKICTLSPRGDVSTVFAEDKPETTAGLFFRVTHDCARRSTIFNRREGFAIADLDGYVTYGNAELCSWPVFTDSPHLVEFSRWDPPGTFLYDLRESKVVRSHPQFSVPAQSLSFPAPRWFIADKEKLEESKELCLLDWRAPSTSAGHITKNLRTKIQHRDSMVVL
jgi:hypothetical protein